MAILSSHLGMGDHIVCNGMAHFLKRTRFPEEDLLVVCRASNLPSVSALYYGFPGIRPLPLGDTTTELDQTPGVVFARLDPKKATPVNWAEHLYLAGGVPFSERWDSFQFNRNPGREAELFEKVGVRRGEPYCLIHDSCSEGQLVLRKLETNLRRIIVRPVEGVALSDWLGIAEAAEEIHCVDSSFSHLIESFPGIGKNLFYHQIRRSVNLFQHRRNWSIIDYEYP